MASLIFALSRMRPSANIAGRFPTNSVQWIRKDALSNRVMSSKLMPDPVEYQRLFHLPTVLKRNYEVLPIMVITAGAVTWLLIFILLSCNYLKVDIKFSSEGQSISESMDLRYPTKHKMYNLQEPMPWPELAELLEDMKEVEKKNYRLMMGIED